MVPRSHLVTIPPGTLLSDALMNSPIIVGEDGSGAVPGLPGASGGDFEFGFDPSTDPELAMVSFIVNTEILMIEGFSFMQAQNMKLFKSWVLSENESPSEPRKLGKLTYFELFCWSLFHNLPECSSKLSHVNTSTFERKSLRNFVKLMFSWKLPIAVPELLS